MNADESKFIEILIANERVSDWLDTITKKQSDKKRLHLSLKQFRQAVETREAYAEEALKAGAVERLIDLLKRSEILENEELFDEASAIIAACSGPMASGIRIRTFTYSTSNGDDISIKVKEGALGDGVGAKVWTVAHIMCREIAEHPFLIQGKTIVELGAGCGAPGFLAAKMGAAQVVITDYVDVLLHNLRDALHLNFPSDPVASRLDEDIENKNKQHDIIKYQTDEHVVDDEEWDLENDDDISEVSDLDAFLAGGLSPGDGDAEKGWEASNCAVRFIDWFDSVTHLDQHANGGDAQIIENRISRAASHVSIASIANSNHSALDGESTRSAAPGVAMNEQFDLVIGTDCLYEWHMAESLAAAIAHRLKPGGRSILCGAVRDQAMFDALISNMEARGLRVGVNRVEPLEKDAGVVSSDQHQYEGGFVLVVAENCEFPADNWHRDDLFPKR